MEKYTGNCCLNHGLEQHHLAETVDQPESSELHPEWSAPQSTISIPAPNHNILPQHSFPSSSEAGKSQSTRANEDQAASWGGLGSVNSKSTFNVSEGQVKELSPIGSANEPDQLEPDKAHREMLKLTSMEISSYRFEGEKKTPPEDCCYVLSLFESDSKRVEVWARYRWLEIKTVRQDSPDEVMDLSFSTCK